MRDAPRNVLCVQDASVVSRHVALTYAYAAAANMMMVMKLSTTYSLPMLQCYSQELCPILMLESSQPFFPLQFIAQVTTSLNVSF
jgi:hypothetical protein